MGKVAAFGVVPGRAVDLRLLGALAAVLIINSHLESYYPLRWIAGDGLLGNSLFFLMSGYGIGCSLRQSSVSSLQFFRARIARLYVPMYVCLALFGLATLSDPTNNLVNAPFAVLVYPTPFQFISLITAFYVLAWLLAQFSVLMRLVVLVASICGYLVALGWTFTHLSASNLSELPSFTHWFYYWLCFSVGAVLVGREAVSVDSAWILGLAAFASLGYIAFKYFVVTRHVTQLLPAVQISALPVAVLLFFACTRPSIFVAIGYLSVVAPVMLWIGTVTLETYMVHSLLIEAKFLSDYQGALPILALFTATFLISWVVARLSAPLQLLLAGRYK
jgi:peptidoglycan/LPS O-acetylase OafA/YrhL